MKISFMTLGCPGWDLDTICARGREYGFDGVDFRGYLDQIDITLLPEFTTHANQTRRQLEDELVRPPEQEESIRRYGMIVDQPGREFVYSNFGYGVLDRVIELPVNTSMFGSSAARLTFSITIQAPHLTQESR